MAYNFPGMPATALPPMGIGHMGPLTAIPTAQNFVDLTGQSFPPLPAGLTLPGMNDAPLEFNSNKTQALIMRDNSEVDNERRNDKNEIRRDRDSRDPRDNSRRQRDRSDRRDRDRRDDRNDRDRREERRHENRDNLSSIVVTSSQTANNSNPLITQNTPTTTTQGLGPQIEPSPNVWSMGISYSMMGLGPMGPLMGEVPLSAHLGPHGFGPMGMGMITPDSAMMNAQILAPEQIISDSASQLINGNLPTSSPQGTKEIIHCKSCTLFPPNPNAPPPTTRERPPGCRTVFVGGLPENINESIIQEIFERCGEIATLRLSKKNFCHIRFASESSVDSAIYLSGYRVRIGSNGDSSNTGRLHVDFAQARDDQYEWECRQRQAQREQRHRERVEKERQRAPTSPPLVVHYTDHEASNICEKIKQDDTFMKAVQVVVTWLERGDCTKRNANTFYSMIQSTNSHVRRLLSEKTIYEEELQKAKELLKGRMQGILIQFSQIERVFSAASHKKVWDHFTKAQRKNIEMWKKQSSEIKAVQLEEPLFDGLMEMDVSDSEDEPQKKKSRTYALPSDDTEKLQSLKEENDSLRCQLEAYKNEVDLLKTDTKSEIEAKEKQIKMLQQTLKGMHEQLIHSKKQQIEDGQKIKDLMRSNKTKKEEIDENEVITLDKDDDSEDELQLKASVSVHISQRDAKLMGLIAIFLHIHPFGASIDYVYYYLQKLESGLRLNEVESLLQRFPHVFKQEVVGIGVNMERRWQFVGLACNKNH